MSRMSPDQNLAGEPSVEGVPASLYNLTKSVPGPFNVIIALNMSNIYSVNW